MKPLIGTKEAIAYAEIVGMRWDDGHPCCPRCGEKERIYIPSLQRKSYRCNACIYDFTAISGTIFASSKLPFHKILKLIKNDYKSATKIAKELKIEYKAAWVWNKKIKDAKKLYENILLSPVSRDFKGYFQRSKP